MQPSIYWWDQQAICLDFIIYIGTTFVKNYWNARLHLGCPPKDHALETGTVEGSGTFWNCSLDDGLSYCGCVSEKVIELDPISLSLIVMAMASSSTYSHT